MRALIVVLLAAVGCGGSFNVSEGAPADASVVDSVATNEAATSDVASTDTANSKDVGVAGDTGTCAPFWCGCGECVPADIICTKSAAGCPLGCPVGACPAMEKNGVCTTVGDRCVRNGIDGTIACLSSADCPPGKCCDGSYVPPAHGVCGGC